MQLLMGLMRKVVSWVIDETLRHFFVRVSSAHRLSLLKQFYFY